MMITMHVVVEIYALSIINIVQQFTKRTTCSASPEYYMKVNILAGNKLSNIIKNVVHDIQQMGFCAIY